MKVLAGDLGGTKLLLALAEVADGRVVLGPVHRYASAELSGLTEAVRRFLAEAGGEAAAACIGVAGPVEATPAGGRARLTNLPWEVDAAELAAAAGVPRARLVNDFAAIARALPALDAETEVVTLQRGRPDPAAPRAALGAGTGLGAALLLPAGDGWRVHATEAGHMDFAPADALETALLEALRAEFGRVSLERVLSGPGLARIHAFLARRRGDQGAALAPPEVVARARAGEPAAAAALGRFVRIYGAQAGNLALAWLPAGGLYLAGGIAPAILDALRQGPFLEAFLAKGRMTPVVARIPVHVVIHPAPGLVGAALCAAEAGAREETP
ncbi:glucokinase [Inmirania thermothiophila]|uniref:Glucokinase n=1 Tax=Inmirania thermothiophila TaxID=1750597 RepID=A0A3N1YAK4_9GAMM|nr:glucokinase [Inmirania thermothiophila]ROR34662.1 glucokinase [Inmirania thermothiophila]